MSITPLKLSQLDWWLRRPRDPRQSTDFAYSRFLVPFLCGYRGTAVFMDCDMLCRDDIYKLVAAADPKASVSVVKHDYVPRNDTKFLGQRQYAYPRKNWSSVMVFNCLFCDALTPEYVNGATGAQLHQFEWLHDSEIASLPREWNWLVGEYDHNPRAKLVHYTLGGPYFNDYKDCDFAEEWRAERDDMMKVMDGAR